MTFVADFLEYRFDHRYAPNSGRVGAEHGGETSVADHTGKAVGFLRLYDAGGDRAQRDCFFERLDRDSANGAGGFFLECAGNSVGEHDILRRHLFRTRDRPNRVSG